MYTSARVRVSLRASSLGMRAAGGQPSSWLSEPHSYVSYSSLSHSNALRACPLLARQGWVLSDGRSIQVAGLDVPAFALAPAPQGSDWLCAARGGLWVNTNIRQGVVLLQRRDGGTQLEESARVAQLYGGGHPVFEPSALAFTPDGSMVLCGQRGNSLGGEHNCRMCVQPSIRCLLPALCTACSRASSHRLWLYIN